MPENFLGPPWPGRRGDTGGNSRLYAVAAICFGRGFTNSKSRAMPTSATPSSPNPSRDDRNLVAVGESNMAPSFEERVHSFWQKNSKVVTAILVVILLGIAAKGAWEYLAARKEREIGRAYAEAATPAQIKTFAAENPDHPLGGVAQLRIADEAYAEARYADAGPAYDQAATSLETGPLASRARLGSAMAKLQSGRTADAQTALKAFAADSKEIKAYRAEALYLLTSLAATGGNAAEVNGYSDQLMQLDPASPWTQRSLALRAKVAPAPVAPAEASPAITLPGSGK